MNIIFTGVINPLRKPGCGAHTLESHNCQQLSGMQLKKKRIKINSKEKKKTSSPPNLKKYSILLAVTRENSRAVDAIENICALM
jgi:hypothetical protein